MRSPYPQALHTDERHSSNASLQLSATSVRSLESSVPSDLAPNQPLPQSHVCNAASFVPRHPLHPPAPTRSAAYVSRLLHAPASVIQSLSQPLSDRVADRYITAIHALCQSTGCAMSWPAFRNLPIDQYAHQMVISPDELRRSLALCFCARLATRKFSDKQTAPMSSAQILNGHKAAPGGASRKSAKTAQTGLKKRKRRHDSSPLRGAGVREARDALVAASWRGFQARQRVIELLRGEEMVTRIREDGLYEDDDDSDLEDGAPRDEYVAAVSELAAAEFVAPHVVREVARKVRELGVMFRRVPPVLCPEEVSGFLRAVFEGRLVDNGGMCEVSEIALRMALYRTEALKWIAMVPFEDVVVEGRRDMRRRFRECVKRDGEMDVHAMVWGVLLQTHCSISEVAEDRTKLGHFGGLMGAVKRRGFVGMVRQWQVEELLSLMVRPNQFIADKLVGNFRSVRRCVRAGLEELEWVFGSEESAHMVSQHVHGYYGEFNILMEKCMRLPYLMSRVVHEQFGSLYNAQDASFTRFMYLNVTSAKGKQKDNGLPLSLDERLQSYCALHQGGASSGAKWARFEASWRLFREVCMVARVVDCVGVTAALLDEDQKGAAVLRRLAKDSVAKTCTRVAGLGMDDAFRLRTFAYAFVPSEGGCG